MIEVGGVFWKVHWSEEGHEIGEWRVRSIRRPPRKRYLYYSLDGSLNPTTVYYVRKIQGVTWIKKSSKNFDYGWDVNIDTYYRASQTLDEYNKNGPPNGLKTTKLQAYNHAIRDCEKSIKGEEKANDPDDFDYIKQLKKTLVSMKSRRSKIRSK